MYSPVQTSRIATLDILRGLALCGMILVHFHQKMESPATGVEDLVGWTIWVGFETKAWSVFAFLFGVGFAILLRNAEARGASIVPLYLRRMAFLAVVGILVQVTTGFQILLEYAMWGVALLIVRKWPTPVLLILALAAAVAGRFYGPIRFILLGSINWITPVDFTLFILGLLAVRHGIFDDVARNKRIIIGAMIFGFVSWAIAWLLYDNGPAEYGILSDRWLALTYAGAVTLLLHYKPVWKDRLALFAKAGRMALTNYVLQAAVIASLATGLALRSRPYADLPATVILFGVLAALSAWWLSRFRYGPLEWLWRIVTYWKWQPIK
jgi:uncharacterized membrane protein YeiB